MGRHSSGVREPWLMSGCGFERIALQPERVEIERSGHGAVACIPLELCTSAEVLYYPGRSAQPHWGLAFWHPPLKFRPSICRTATHRRGTSEPQYPSSSRLPLAFSCRQSPSVCSPPCQLRESDSGMSAGPNSLNAVCFQAEVWPADASPAVGSARTAVQPFSQ